MREEIKTIRSPLIDNFSRIIQRLAKRGRNDYQEYLIKPLAGWKSPMPTESIDKLIGMIERAESHRSNKLPLLYKMAIIKSLEPDQLDMSIPGNLCLKFLSWMKNSDNVSDHDEPLEFMNLLKDTFKDFSDREFIKINRQFEQNINEAEAIEVEKLIKIREGTEEAQKKSDKETQEALADIEQVVKNGKMPDIKRAVIVFIIRFADPSMPNRHKAVYEIIDRISRKDKNLKKDILDSAAVITYHEILKSIKEGNLARAVTYISKYAVLFRGNPQTPNYQEVDSFEKKFFQIIEERNLWDRL